jgi:hypothetical protein
MNPTRFGILLTIALSACIGDQFTDANNPADPAELAPVNGADAGAVSPTLEPDAAPPPADAPKPTCVTFAECQWCGNPAYASVVAVSCACRCR